MFSAWGNGKGNSQTLLQLVLCSKLTQCQENANLTMHGFMKKSIRGGLRKIRTRHVQKVHCTVKPSTFRTRERQRCLAILKARTHRDEYRRTLFASIFQRAFCVHTQAIFADDEPSEHANSFPDIRWRLM